MTSTITFTEPATHEALDEHWVQSSQDPDIKLFVRYRAPSPHVKAQAVPLLMVHGATLSSLLWDHPDTEWSWMDQLASQGFHVYALDLRGYGRTTRPDWSQHHDLTPYARAEDVLGDVNDAIEYVRRHANADEVDLLGGSWGSVICGLFMARGESEKVRRLVLYAPIYCEPNTTSTWWKSAADPLDTSRVNPQLGAYRWVSKADIQSRWDSEIPFQDKTVWRPQQVFDQLFEAVMEQDPEGWNRNPPAFRVPNGTLVDLFEIYSGRPLYNATLIKVPTLLIRADHDQTSTQEGSQRLFADLGADKKRFVQVGNGAHFVILEKHAQQIHREVSTFLAEN